MRQALLGMAAVVGTACGTAVPPPSPTYLFVWAGDSAGTASDFLAVLDATPSSPQYGTVVATRPTGAAGTHPHHTEDAPTADGHLLANGFHAGRTWLWDLSAPRAPRILTAFGRVAGFSHPHSFARLRNGHVLATFQYAASAGPPGVGKYCGVPVLTGRYWLQTVPEAHAVVVLDVSDPAHPRQVSTLALGDDEEPHWLAVDATGRRLVVNSAGYGGGNRVFLLDLDPATGALTLDARFRDAGATRPGVRFSQRRWPHGTSGTAIPHGSAFSR